ncbi:hypothetical protein ACBR55_12250 [Salinicoccus roseus]|uniref:hypothetical protein n=1 Tax=Salinicoccus roseus TaxID=45670 RepID=UPI0035256935
MAEFPVRARDFAAAYIQTLPHARKEEEFANYEEFVEYLDNRQATYFREFLRASQYAHEEVNRYKVDDNEDE